MQSTPFDVFSSILIKKHFKKITFNFLQINQWASNQKSLKFNMHIFTTKLIKQFILNQVIELKWSINNPNKNLLKGQNLISNKNKF